MEKVSLRQNIINYLQYNQSWTNGGQLEVLAMNLGKKASNASRRCRELVEDDILERRENNKGHVEYRYKIKGQQTLI